MRVVSSAIQAIEVLGGIHEVARMFNPELGYRTVYNWKKRELPPDTYHVLGPALVREHCTFSPLLFAQKLPASSKPKRRGRPRKDEQSLSI